MKVERAGSEQTATTNVMGGLAAFASASIAQGMPFVVIVAELGSRGPSTTAIAAVAAARLLPYLVCSPIAGALAARVDLRRLWLLTGVLRSMVIAAIGLALAVGASPVVAVVSMFTLVAVGTPAYPTLMRFLHERVPRDRWNRTSAIAAGVESAGFCVGPAIGGAMLLIDPNSAIAVAFAMSLIAIALGTGSFLVRPVVSAHQESTRVDRPTAFRPRVLALASVGHLLAPTARRAVIAATGVNMLGGLVAALLIDVSQGFDEPRTYGLLSFFIGAGAVAGFLVVALVDGRHRPMLALAGAGSAVAALATTSQLWVAVVAAGVFGASVLSAEVIATAAMGATTSSRSVAAAIGMLDAWIVAAMLAGAAVAPLFTVAIGTRSTLLLLGAGAIVVAVAAPAAPRRPAPTRRFATARSAPPAGQHHPPSIARFH